MTSRIIRTLLPLVIILPAFAAEPEPEVKRLPTTNITDSLLEERPVGETKRPEWTSARRFANSRVYIQKEPWEVGIEQWWRIRDNRDNTVENLFIEEIEIGLPHRMQLDLYGNWTVDEHRKARFENFAVELRWALADWGVIPMNPTLYAEYKFVTDGADVWEVKLLLGDEIAPRWHYGINIAWETEMGGERAHEFQVNGGLSYTLIQEKLGIGVEWKYVNESIRDERGDAEQKFPVGPSLQWRISEHMHLDLACLFGTNHDAQRHEGFLIFGYDFGQGGHDEREYTPVSGLRN